MAPQFARRGLVAFAKSGEEKMTVLTWTKSAIGGVFWIGALVASDRGLAETYIFDTKHAEVQFTYYVGPLSQSGRFTDLDGLVEFDQQAPERGFVNAVIKTASLTANQWQDQLRGSDFFDVAVWPEIRFKSRTMRPTGANSAALSGDLTINGVTQPVTLQMNVDPPLWGPSRAGEQAPAQKSPKLNATARIHRSAFNMTALGFLVDDEIDIQIKTQLQKK